MAEQKKRDINDVKSLALTGLVLGPIAIGLGIGFKDGIAAMQANKPVLSPSVGGKPNYLEMIGRDIGRNTQTNIARALQGAKTQLQKGLSDIDSADFAKKLYEAGPQRNALIAAYKNILNSPYLGLSPDMLQAEENDILASIGSKKGQDFATDMITRIKKRMMEFGPDRQGEFLSELQSEFKRQLKLESALDKSGVSMTMPALEFKHPIETVKLNAAKIKSSTTKGSVGTRVKESLSQLERVLADEGMSNYKFNIYRVTDTRSGGAAYMARVTTNRASFDVPLALRRQGGMKGAPGGLAFISSAKGADVQYKTAVVVGTAMPNMQAAPGMAEDFFISEFRKSIKGLKGGSRDQYAAAAANYLAETYDKGQRLSQFYSPAQESLSTLKAWEIFDIQGFTPGNLEHEKILRSNTAISPLGITQTGLAEGKRYAAGAPTLEKQLTLFNPASMAVSSTVAPQIPITSKFQAVQKETTIVGANKLLNDKLGWMENSLIGYRAQDDLNTAMIQMQQRARTSNLVFYQFEETLDKGIADTYMTRLGLGEGTYLGMPKVYSVTSAPIRGVQAIDSLSNKSTPLMNYLMTQAERQATAGQPLDIRLSRRQLKKFGTLLGRTGGGAIAQLPSDSNIRGIRIMGITKDRKGLLDFSYETEYSPGQFGKMHGLGVKGHVVRPATETMLAREAGETFGGGQRGQGLVTRLLGNAPVSSAIIASDKQIIRTPLGMMGAIWSSSQLALAQFTSLGKGDIEQWASRFHGGRYGTTSMAVQAAKKLASHGVDPTVIAGVVAGAWRTGDERQKRAIELAASKVKGFNTGAFQGALKEAKGFFGVETLGIAKGAELQGGGRPGTFERRTIHGLLQNLKSSGATDEQATTIISDILSRAGGVPAHQQLLTSRVLNTSALSMKGSDRLADLERMAKDFGFDFSVTSKSVSQISNVNLKGEDWFKRSSMVKLKFDTEASRAAALQRFGTDEILVPGQGGLPALEKMRVKRGNEQIALQTEYEKSLQQMLKASVDPTADRSAIESSMEKFQRELTLQTAEVNLGMYSGKIQASTSGRLMSLNMATFPDTYKTMMSQAMKDQLQSAFVTDQPFLNYIENERQRLKVTFGNDINLIQDAQTQLKSKTKAFLFNEDMVDSVMVRHPSLGESHARVTGVRRVISSRQNQALLGFSDVRSFLRKNKFDVSAKGLAQFLSGQGKINAGLKEEFTDIYMGLAGRMKGTESSIYLPESLPGKVTIGGIDGGQRSVVHRFSRATQMFGDFDGDIASLFMTTTGPSNRVMRDVLRGGKAAEAFFRSNIEFRAMQELAKNTQAKRVVGGSTIGGIVDDVYEGVLKLVQGKNVQLYSTALDALRVGTLSMGREKPELARQSLAALDVLEEMLLKSKKATRALNIGDEFAKAVLGDFTKGKRFGPDKQKFLNIVYSHAFEQGAKIDVSANLADFMGNGGTVSSHLDMDETLNFLWDNYQELRNSGGLSGRSIKQIVNTIKREGVDDPRLTKMLENLYEGRHGLVQSAMAESAGVVAPTEIPEFLKRAQAVGDNVLGETKSLLRNPRVLAPLGLGIGAGLLALNAVAPGYSSKPLAAPNETISPATKDAVMSGSILSGLSDVINGEPLMPRSNDIPGVNPHTILPGETYIQPASGQSGRIESTINGIENLQPVQNVIGAMGLRNNHIYIQDNRRPVTKNYIDKFREK